MLSTLLNQPLRIAMTTYLSDFAKCGRCGSAITDRSAYAIRIWSDDDSVRHDTVMSKNLTRDSVAIHMGGDRECRRELSGFHGKILKNLDLPVSCDTSVLDRL